MIRYIFWTLLLCLQPEYTNVCFWYIPPSLRRLPHGPELWKKLHTVSNSPVSSDILSCWPEKMTTVSVLLVPASCCAAKSMIRLSCLVTFKIYIIPDYARYSIRNVHQLSHNRIIVQYLRRQLQPPIPLSMPCRNNVSESRKSSQFLLIAPVGGPGGERAHDEEGKHDDWLSDPLWQAQLFQDGSHQSSGQQGGPGLCPGWDPQPGKGLVMQNLFSYLSPAMYSSQHLYYISVVRVWSGDVWI